MNQMDRSAPNGPKWTARIKGAEVDRFRSKWTKWTEVDGMDQSGLKQTKGTEVDRFRSNGPNEQKWTKWTEVDWKDLVGP